jgi:WD40 repeat protein
VVSGSWDNTLRLWDVKTGAPVGEALIGHTSDVTSVVFSPDGRYVISKSDSGTIVHDVESRQQLCDISKFFQSNPPMQLPLSLGWRTGWVSIFGNYKLWWMPPSNRGVSVSGNDGVLCTGSGDGRVTVVDGRRIVAECLREVERLRMKQIA